MSDDRWTVEEIELLLARPARVRKLWDEQISSLLMTALDALKAQPRWVRVSDLEDTKEVRVAGTSGRDAQWALVVPLPLPPLPEEDGDA